MFDLFEVLADITKPDNLVKTYTSNPSEIVSDCCGAKIINGDVCSECCRRLDY